MFFRILIAATLLTLNHFYLLGLPECLKQRLVLVVNHNHCVELQVCLVQLVLQQLALVKEWLAKAIAASYKLVLEFLHVELAMLLDMECPKELANHMLELEFQREELMVVKVCELELVYRI